MNIIRKMLRRIGFCYIFSAIINGDQGFEPIGELQFLENERVTNICRVIFRTGGTDTNNNPNHGKNISLKSKEILKLVFYYIKNKKRVYRDATVSQISLTYI